jgi:ATP-dependent DNA helicase RecG
MSLENPFWQTPIAYLKGIGPAKAELLKKDLGILTYQDLLSHYPFRYIDRSKWYSLSEIHSELPYVQVIGTLVRMEITGHQGSKRLIAELVDDTGSLELVWFQAIRYMEKSLVKGEKYIVFGKPTRFKERWNMVHPEMELYSQFKTQSNTSFQPVYHSSEKLKKSGLDSGGLLKLIQYLIQIGRNKMEESLPSFVLYKYRLPSRGEALENIHSPKDSAHLLRARTRLKFEELFFIQLKVLRIRDTRKKTIKGYLFPEVGNYFLDFYHKKLPFELTQAQKKVLREIRQDTLRGQQMNRLLQGDVGSGKTMVAILTILLAVDNGFQSLFMAPTEILAQQHFDSFKQFLGEDFIQFSLLTGSTPKSKRKSLFESLENGNLQVLIGTHALLEDTVQPKNLGLVIIDEQHRFGVEQRSRLWVKNESAPHVLVMTATPIPRTLAMTLYGDLDVSILDELPKGRKPIKTEWFQENQRLRVLGIMKEEIRKGRQVYVVYPLIEESAKMDYLNLFQGFEQLERTFPKPEYQISIVHGRMSSKDKDFEMGRFIRKETQIMVATTVIEVGVNVPNATVMVIESAERFGLSTLHQLRGRVGRGADQSHCLLISGYKLSKIGKTRLETMVRTQDGFEIAEMDMSLRGPGDIEGTQQSGVLDLKLADLGKDYSLLTEARATVTEILEQDPQLELPEHQVLQEYFRPKTSGGIGWEKIS